MIDDTTRARVERARKLIDAMHAERFNYSEYVLLRDALDALEARLNAAISDLIDVLDDIRQGEGVYQCAYCTHGNGDRGNEPCEDCLFSDIPAARRKIRTIRFLWKGFSECTE